MRINNAKNCDVGKFMRRFATLSHLLILFFLIASATTISCSATDQAISAKDLTYITEQYPPYNYQENGKLQGISVDLLENMWVKMEANLNRSVIRLLPWSEGYQTTLKENNTILFTTFRTPQREQLFKWVGPIALGRDTLLARSDRNINITTPVDLKKYKIGAIKDDIAAQRLLNNGLKQEDLILENTSKPIIEMLKNETIDAWAYNDLAGISLLQQSGANLSDYKVAFILGQDDGYYAFNKETPDSIAQSFQQALDYIKNNKDSSGTSDYEKILNKYIPSVLSKISAAASGQNTPNANLYAVGSEATLPFMLLQIQADVQAGLNSVDSDVSNASQNLSTVGLEGIAARNVLRKLLDSDSNVIEAATFGKDGRIITAECKGCESGEGANISSQEHIAYVLKNKKPMFSKEFKLVEGFNGTALAYPVISPKGELLGGISAIIKADMLLNALVAPQLHFNISTRSNITDYSFWMLTLDGIVAYDRDESQIGKYLFTDPLYQPFPSLLDLGRRIVDERSGHGYYSFQVTEANRNVVTKESYWTTAGLHGREWRLVATKIV